MLHILFLHEYIHLFALTHINQSNSKRSEKEIWIETCFVIYSTNCLLASSCAFALCHKLFIELFISFCFSLFIFLSLSDTFSFPLSLRFFWLSSSISHSFPHLPSLSHLLSVSLASFLSLSLPQPPDFALFCSLACFAFIYELSSFYLFLPSSSSLFQLFSHFLPLLPSLSLTVSHLFIAHLAKLANRAHI